MNALTREQTQAQKVDWERRQKWLKVYKEALSKIAKALGRISNQHCRTYISHPQDSMVVYVVSGFLFPKVIAEIIPPAASGPHSRSILVVVFDGERFTEIKDVVLSILANYLKPLNIAHIMVLNDGQ